jgi:hypothetical protein
MSEAGERRYAKISGIQAQWVNRLSRDLKAGDVERAVALLREIEVRLR